MEFIVCAGNIYADYVFMKYCSYFAYEFTCIPVPYFYYEVDLEQGVADDAFFQILHVCL